MATSDDLTYGQRSNMSHNIRELDRIADRFFESLETVRRTAPAIMVGMENELSVATSIIPEIKKRWEYFQANDQWPDMPTASSEKHGK
jgi:hypothetical protein